MLKRFIKASIRCPVVVYEEIEAVFLERKNPKMTKYFVLRFHALRQIFDRLCGLVC